MDRPDIARPFSSDVEPISYPMSIGGIWGGASQGRARIMPVVDPENGRTIAIVPRADAADVETALRTARSAKMNARRIATHERIAILARVAGLVADNAESLATIIASEGIKTIREARLEVARCATTLQLCAEEARRMVGETILFDQRPGSEERTGYSFREPVGVVLAITPFNDPLNLVAHKIGPAIAAGNAVILKPHERTPLSALHLAALFERAGLPAEVLQVLTGSGSEIGDQLVDDARIDLVSFTGGKATGRRIASRTGLKRTAFELGGNCATIVLADADLDRAAERCVSGAYWAAGQNCLHVQRLFIQAGVYEAFKARFVERASRYRLGEKLDPTTDMGCLIDRGSADRIANDLDSAVASGATIIIGGHGRDTSFLPTLIENVPCGHKLAAEEVFGPVTVIAAIADLDEAIEVANAVDYGLHAAVFTNSLAAAHACVHRLETGAVLVNDSTDYRIDAMPFGGVKGSGFGREGVKSAIDDMTDVKVVCFDHRCTTV
jgi:glyceraldehyde-3-phosphate dehydrogenase (NADP+)